MMGRDGCDGFSVVCLGSSWAKPATCAAPPPCLRARRSAMRLGRRRHARRGGAAAIDPTSWGSSAGLAEPWADALEGKGGGSLSRGPGPPLWGGDPGGVSGFPPVPRSPPSAWGPQASRLVRRPRRVRGRNWPPAAWPPARPQRPCSRGGKPSSHSGLPPVRPAILAWRAVGAASRPRPRILGVRFGVQVPRWEEAGVAEGAAAGHERWRRRGLRQKRRGMVRPPCACRRPELRAGCRRTVPHRPAQERRQRRGLRSAR